MSGIIKSLVYIPRSSMQIYAYPELPQNTPYIFGLLPTLAFADTNHNPIYFIVPSSQPIQRMYGVSLVYPTHALVLLTTTFLIDPLNKLLNCYYSLFTRPSPQLLTALYNAMDASKVVPTPIIPTEALLSNITKIIKLMLLPFRTVLYSQIPANTSLSLLFIMSSIPGTFFQTKGDCPNSLAFPLKIDTPTHPIIPHFPTSWLDKIIGADGYVIGTTSPIFSELTKDWDVVINLDNGKVRCQKDVQNVIAETREDKLFILQMKEMYQRKQIDNVMLGVEWYVQGLLNTIAPFAKKVTSVSWNEIANTPANDYGIAFLKEWLSAPSFQEWKERVCVDQALKFDVKHPGRTSKTSFGSYTSESITSMLTTDWMIKGAVKVDNFYRGIEKYWTKEEEEAPVEDTPIVVTEKSEIKEPLDVVEAKEEKKELPKEDLKVVFDNVEVKEENKEAHVETQ
ncbi:hypothetical protein EIN_198050 [Entamoeba invadens IP1]|uniref:AVL9/DENND6 domain-containing protein n=1 Tax=Entamoeba invadens IP1 TaxID=370355 RepID=A0A0A1TUQ7_ENTIV|nr:hypothetical protein EIN_198050 [Entamoeba invadens IP1]ELP83852.1 hypothetical protein EIN_198050 [Entamoeba invadens IP1]|eukprot:XP_004183198.1 hypothetical protein EIN_198050 [Entamoeba invadens IP1]